MCYPVSKTVLCYLSTLFTRQLVTYASDLWRNVNLIRQACSEILAVLTQTLRLSNTLLPVSLLMMEFNPTKPVSCYTALVLIAYTVTVWHAAFA